MRTINHLAIVLSALAVSSVASTTLADSTVIIVKTDSIPTEDQILGDKRSKPVEEEELVGRTFVLTRPGYWNRVLKFGTRTVELANNSGATETILTRKGNKICLNQDCYRAYRSADGRYAAFDTTGAFMGWLFPAK